jgi:hypothetical protein
MCFELGVQVSHNEQGYPFRRALCGPWTNAAAESKSKESAKKQPPNAPQKHASPSLFF